MGAHENSRVLSLETSTTRTHTHARARACAHAHTSTCAHAHTNVHICARKHTHPQHPLTLVDQRGPVAGLERRQFCTQPQNFLTSLPILRCNHLRLAHATSLAESFTWRNRKPSIGQKHAHVSTQYMRRIFRRWTHAYVCTAVTSCKRETQTSWHVSEIPFAPQ